MATKQMKLRRDGTCDRCSLDLPSGTYAVYDSGSRSVRCVTHVEPPVEDATQATSPAPPQEELAAPEVPEVPLPSKAATLPADEGLAIDPPAELHSSVAGSSARREYERRKAKDEAKLREEWGRLGGLAVALSSEKQSTKAWDRGAVGEEKLGRLLDSLAGEGVAVLHDRRIPKTKANVDHIVVTAGGVWVVDAKRYRGRPELRVEGGLLGPRVEKLMVAGRDRSKLVEGVNWQVDLVSAALTAAGKEVPVRGVLCFVDADWPLFGGSFAVAGVAACWPAHLSKLLRADAGDQVVSELTAQLAAHFPAA